MPPLCTCRLNWARRTSWDWMRWHCHQTENSKFEPWRPEAEHATSRSRRFPTILNHYVRAGENHCVSLKLECQGGVRDHDLRLSKQAALTTAPEPPCNGKRSESDCCLPLHNCLYTCPFYFQIYLHLCRWWGVAHTIYFLVGCPP